MYMDEYLQHRNKKSKGPSCGFASTSKNFQKQKGIEIIVLDCNCGLQ